MSQVDVSLPGYVEVQELGSGAQGRVVLARHEASGQHVAVKFLAPALLRNEHARTVFRNEAALLQRVTSPHVARLYGYTETSEGAAIIMEAVPGTSLRSVLDHHEGALDPEAALSILKGSLQGLAAAHAVGVVHRDYKPANVLVQADGQSKLIDFGVAVLAGQGGRMGTPAYMAPEQWAGGPATPATDVYAATCVFFECVTGRKPFRAPTQQGLQAQHIAAPVPLEEVPEPLRPLVAYGMAKDPALRRRDVTTFISEVEAVATSAYGKDWERRGLIALGGVTAAAGIAVPATLVGGALLPGGGALAPAGSLAGEAAHTLTGKGFLAKIGGAKVAGGTGAAVAAGAMLAVVLWPEAPEVGGTSTAEYRAYFERPGVVLSNRTIPDGDNTASPLIALQLTLTPARATAGTKVRMTVQRHSRAPWGLEYLGPGRFRCRGPNSEGEDALHQGYSVGLGDGILAGKKGGTPKVWFFPAGNSPSGAPPTGKPVPVKSTYSEGKQTRNYDQRLCAWTFDLPTVSEFTVPSPTVLKPGRYKVSPHHPMGFSEVTATVNGRLTPLNPASVGARVDGTVPTLEVLDS